ncbi:transposase [Pseudomonas marginalis]|uniref:transposase n=1 Tax=Pseudomonas marginalis TaxID=298 RepID=UPI0039A11432
MQSKTVEAAGYVVVVTTLNCLDAQGILALYRHRWQVELAFKRMKSLLGLSHLRKKNPEGAKAWLQGKLLVACLIERLIATGEHFSPLEGQGSQRASDTPALPLA